MGYYHQDDRDRAVAMGCMGIVVVALLAVCAIAAVVAWTFSHAYIGLA